MWAIQDVVQGLGQEFDLLATTIAETDLDEASWRHLKGRAIGLIERGNSLVAVIDGMDRVRWTATQWYTTDSPVMLARAFSMTHRRVGGVLAGSTSTTSDLLRTCPRRSHSDATFV